MNYDKFIDDGVGLIIHPSEKNMTDELEYWEGPDIHDLTLDEMIAEIESYIKFVRRVFFFYPEFDISGYVRLGFARRGDSDRWEMVAFDPYLDSVYTTTDVVNAICEKYPDVTSDSGRNVITCKKCGSPNHTDLVLDGPKYVAAGGTHMTCDDCGHVECHGYKVVKYRHHIIRMEW